MTEDEAHTQNGRSPIPRQAERARRRVGRAVPVSALGPQSFVRFHAQRAEGGTGAGREPHQEQYHHAHRQGLPRTRERRAAVGDEEHSREGEPQEHAESELGHRPADHRHDEPAPTRTERRSDPDLGRPFGHRERHDGVDAGRGEGQEHGYEEAGPEARGEHEVPIPLSDLVEGPRHRHDRAGSHVAGQLPETRHEGRRIRSQVDAELHRSELAGREGLVDALGTFRRRDPHPQMTDHADDLLPRSRLSLPPGMEPDPAAQRILAKRVADAVMADPHNQYFITTHSPYLVTAVLESSQRQEAAVFLVEYENHKTTTQRLTESQINELLYTRGSMFFNFDVLTD